MESRTVSLGVSDFRQGSLDLRPFLEIFAAVKGSFKRALSLGDLIGFQVDHRKMILQYRTVGIFRYCKLVLITGQDIVTQFIVYPYQSVPNGLVRRLTLVLY